MVWCSIGTLHYVIRCIQLTWVLCGVTALLTVCVLGPFLSYTSCVWLPFRS